jgi:hypothetical protein
VSPTAQYVVVVGTSTMLLRVEVRGVGITVCVHVVPFQCAVAGPLWDRPDPTAQTSVGADAATESSGPLVVLRATLHDAPFQ